MLEPVRLDALLHILAPEPDSPTASKRRKRWAVETFDGFVRDLVARRLKDGWSNGRRDLLATLVDGREDQAEAIRDDVAGLLIAGRKAVD